MRKSVIVVTVALVGMLVAAPMASAAPLTDDAKKACADIVNGRSSYFSDPNVEDATSAKVVAEMDLLAQACKNVTYTMTVLTSDTDSTVLATAPGVSVSAAADGSTPPRVVFESVFPLPAPPGICVVFTTSKSNGTLLDSAPDTSCVPLTLDGPPASQKFR